MRHRMRTDLDVHQAETVNLWDSASTRAIGRFSDDKILLTPNDWSSNYWLLKLFYGLSKQTKLTKNSSSMTGSPSTSSDSMFIERYLCDRSFFLRPQLPTSLNRCRNLFRFLIATGNVVVSPIVRPAKVPAVVVPSGFRSSFLVIGSTAATIPLPFVLNPAELVGDGGDTF